MGRGIAPAHRSLGVTRRSGEQLVTEIVAGPAYRRRSSEVRVTIDINGAAVMPTELHYFTDQVIRHRRLLTFVASRLGAQIRKPRDGSPRYAHTAGMGVFCAALPRRVRNREREYLEQSTAASFGFRTRSSVYFQLRGVASLEESDHAWAQVLELAIDLAAWRLGDAVLVFNREQILMRCTRAHGVVFDNWEAFAETPELAMIVARCPQRTLDQPLL
ncbi:hypothetical protein HDA40_002101 [Hamadaea flava]|uniref:Uncharacterized protein n=1 Tax=Hamadaea flava TaxID=1742688 RepID=A0ABV8LKK3_9ACTN|nr:hypothetical protein [Hamadaea flava]MCP2323594.1 hypothetical protein [Hamadaea flava]